MGSIRQPRQTGTGTSQDGKSGREGRGRPPTGPGRRNGFVGRPLPALWLHRRACTLSACPGPGRVDAGPHVPRLRAVAGQQSNRAGHDEGDRGQRRQTRRCGHPPQVSGESVACSVVQKLGRWNMLLTTCCASCPHDDRTSCCRPPPLGGPQQHDVQHHVPHDGSVSTMFPMDVKEM